MAQTDKIVEMAAQKSIDKENKVFEAISKLKSKDMELSISNIAKEAGCSRKYIYSNDKLLEYIKKEQDGFIIPEDTKKQIELLENKINQLENENKELKKEIKNFKDENSETYKQKYNKVKNENDELKKQLRKAYEYYPKETT